VTGPGAEFYESCRRILGEFKLAASELAQTQRQPKGLLKVNAPMSFGQLHLAPALIEFLDSHAGIAIQLSMTDAFVDVVDGGYDLVLRIGALRGSSLVARRLCPIRRVLCAAPAYLARQGAPAIAADLAGHRLLNYGHEAIGTRWHLFGPEGEATVEVASALCANNGDVLKTAALAGTGIAMLPTFLCADELRRGTLVQVLPGLAPRAVALHAIWPASRVQPTRLRAFIDFLVARFGGDRPAWDQGIP
jgi:DNA-binding transcriptional LysR family regulator